VTLAFRCGSSKQGKAARASVGSKCVVAIHLQTSNINTRHLMLGVATTNTMVGLPCDIRCKLKHMKGSVKEPNTFHNYETEKITRKASDVAVNLQL